MSTARSGGGIARGRRVLLQEGRTMPHLAKLALLCFVPLACHLGTRKGDLPQSPPTRLGDFDIQVTPWGPDAATLSWLRSELPHQPGLAELLAGADHRVLSLRAVEGHEKHDGNELLPPSRFEAT